MRGCFNNPKGLLLSGILLFATVLVSFAFSVTLAEQTAKDKTEPIVVRAKRLELDEAHNKITFKGGVNAESKDFTINCQEMAIYYVSEQGAGKRTGLGTKIDKIVARGDVRIKRQEGGVATSQEAVYFWAEEKLVLTGNPKVTQGNDFVKGHKIILYLKENRSVVESSGDETVKAVIFPKEGKKP